MVINPQNVSFCVTFLCQFYKKKWVLWVIMACFSVLSYNIHTENFGFNLY